MRFMQCHMTSADEGGVNARASFICFAAYFILSRSCWAGLRRIDEITNSPPPCFDFPMIRLRHFIPSCLVLWRSFHVIYLFFCHTACAPFIHIGRWSLSRRRSLSGSRHAMSSVGRKGRNNMICTE